MAVRLAQEDLWAKGARWRWSAESMGLWRGNPRERISHSNNNGRAS